MSQLRDRPLTAAQLEYAALDAWVLFLGLHALGQTIQNVQMFSGPCAERAQRLKILSCMLDPLPTPLWERLFLQGAIKK